MGWLVWRCIEGIRAEVRLEREAIERWEDEGGRVVDDDGEEVQR